VLLPFALPTLPHYVRLPTYPAISPSLLPTFSFLCVFLPHALLLLSARVYSPWRACSPTLYSGCESDASLYTHLSPCLCSTGGVAVLSVTHTCTAAARQRRAGGNYRLLRRCRAACTFAHLLHAGNAPALGGTAACAHGALRHGGRAIGNTCWRGHRTRSYAHAHRARAHLRAVCGGCLNATLAAADNGAASAAHHLSEHDSSAHLLRSPLLPPSLRLIALAYASRNILLHIGSTPPLPAPLNDAVRGCLLACALPFCLAIHLAYAARVAALQRSAARCLLPSLPAHRTIPRAA